MFKKLAAGISTFTLVLCIGCALIPPSAGAAVPPSVRCDPAGRLNRPGCTGYFTGTYFYSSTYGIQGQNIIDCTKGPSACVNGESVNNAIPDTVQDANSFIQWLEGYLELGSGNGYDYNKAGAAFIVDTMLGKPGTDFSSTTDGIAYAQNNISTWENAVRGLDNKGLVTWDWATTLPANTVNSLHACWPPISDCEPTNISGNDGMDFAFFNNTNAEASHLIIIRSPTDGSIIFEIRRECANVLGTVQGVPAPAYNLSAGVTSTVNGATANLAEPGNSVQFTYTVTNTSTYASSSPATCTIYSINRSGYVSGSPPPGGGDPSQSFSCPAIGSNSTYTVPATGAFAGVTAQPNTTYCRLLVISPASDSGGSTQAEACVVVISKPYAKVFGGDVSAGGGFGTTTCTEDKNAAIVGWNQRSTSFAGAGTEYAAYVLNTLQDFGTAQNGAAGGAPPPSGLAFSNQGITGANKANGTYGNSFGPSLPCITDYASQVPSNANKVAAPGGGGLNLATLPNGASTYTGGGNLTITNSTLGAGQNIVLYVPGNVYINGNILYGGSWTMDQIPNLQLVVSGNIYINGGVSEIDGNYIAQPSSGAGGTIYTCTDPSSPFAPISLTTPGNTIYSNCATKLTVNGTFTASQVELLRTTGTLGQSSPTETSGGNSAAEAFNFNPSLWIAQPQQGSSKISTSDDYDSIVSLPPVL